MPWQRKVVLLAQNKDFNPANFDAGQRLLINVTMLFVAISISFDPHATIMADARTPSNAIATPTTHHPTVADAIAPNITNSPTVADTILAQTAIHTVSVANIKTVAGAIAISWVAIGIAAHSDDAFLR
ncbi:MAG: hypothetical protein AAFY78_16965 [Cyanobacteria bacterium J06648_16]